MKAANRSSLRDQRLQAEGAGLASPEMLVVAEASQQLPYTGRKVSTKFSGYNCGSPLDKRGLCEAVASSCGDSEGHVSEIACPSPIQVTGCPELLHELSNLMTSVLLNAQLLEWKLPPYSHLKRPVREVARNAQRATELMKRLQRRLADGGSTAQADHQPQGATGNLGMASPWPGGESANTTALPIERSSPQSAIDLTTACDSGTSDTFPKRDDRYGQ